MGTADIVTKEYMRGNAVFADAFNYLIYNGKKVIDPANLKEIDPTEIALPFDDEAKAGKELCYYLNYSKDPVSVTHRGKDGIELVSETSIVCGDKIDLGGWGVAVVEM